MVNQNAQKVFIGIDVHKTTYSVSCVVEGEVLRKCRMKANFQGLLGFIKKFFPDYQVFSVYEAGFSGYELHRFLIENNISNIIVHPAAVEISSRDKVKTDKRDATKLAIQLFAKRLRGIRVPSREQEQKRQLTRTRAQLVKHRTSIKNQIRAKLLVFNLLDPDDTREMSLRLLAPLLEKDLCIELRASIECLLAVWEQINTQIKELQRKLRAQACSDPHEKVYRSIPGAGALTARILSNELGDLQQFSNVKQLYSYTGLTPSERSSGEHIRRGNISRQGAARIRHVLVELAWRAIRRDEKLNKDFHSIAKRSNKLKAIVAIARKLIGRARALFRTGEQYQVAYSVA